MRVLSIVFFCIITASCAGRNVSASNAAVAEMPLTAGEELPVNTGDGNPVRVGETVEFDKTVHDFGDITTGDGPQTCTFTVKNISGKPIAIYEVVSSCGCTGVTWTREPLQPGKTGAITATYKNEDGPYPFNKTLTVYISDMKKPVVLRLRGTVHDRKKSLEELYGAYRFGPLGMKETEIQAGNLEQGMSKTEVVHLANLGKSPVEVSFAEVSQQMALRVSPNPVPPGQTADLTITVEADRSLWGRNRYEAVLLAGGRRTGAQRLHVWAFTKENFASWSEEEIAAGSRPVFGQSTYSFDKVRTGAVVQADFTLTNKGKSAFHCYKIDCDSDTASASPLADVAPGASGTLHVEVDTAVLPAGEQALMLTLTTNSPSRPIINLFIVGMVE